MRTIQVTGVARHHRLVHRCAPGAEDATTLDVPVGQVPLCDGTPRVAEQPSTYEGPGFDLTDLCPVVRDGGRTRTIELGALVLRAPATSG